MITTTLNPTHVDTVWAEQEGHLDRAEARVEKIHDSLHHLVGDKRQHGTWAMTHRDALDVAHRRSDEADISLRLGMLTGAENTRLTYETALNALEAIWQGAGGWTRFWRVPDGHVHGRRRCQTLHREGKTTTLCWMPELAGHTVDEAIGLYGELMCSVCFPEAPTDPRYAAPGTIAAAEREAKAAAKAEQQVTKDAERAVKGITNPDGSELVLGAGILTDRPKTLIAAQRLLLERLGDAAWYRAVHTREGRPGGHPDEAAWLADAEILIAAIAAKTGRTADDLRAEYQAKADKKTARDSKN